MCEWGKTETMCITIPASISRTGKEREKNVSIDSCIVPIVRALNDAGITTIASCCGHGKRPGFIALIDGRELIIAKNWEEASMIDKAFPSISGEENDGS